MFKWIILVSILIVMLAMLTTCGVCYCKMKEKEPPTISQARYALEVRVGPVLTDVYLTDSYSMDGEDYILTEYYEKVNDVWRYKDERPLRITPNWGKVTVLRRS